MRYLCNTILAAVLFAACNEQPSKINEKNGVMTDTVQAEENNIQVAGTTCFTAINGRDTIMLRVDKFPHVVTGMLSYNIYEKDKNSGDIDGLLHGDTLIADYTFMSEGAKSVRQVAFILTDSTAAEGYGDMEEQNGKMVFKNISTLDFSKSPKLAKAGCPGM